MSAYLWSYSSVCFIEKRSSTLSRKTVTPPLVSIFPFPSVFVSPQSICSEERLHPAALGGPHASRLFSTCWAVCQTDIQEGKQGLKKSVTQSFLFSFVSQKLRECVTDVSSRGIIGQRGTQSKCHHYLLIHTNFSKFAQGARLHFLVILHCCLCYCYSLKLNLTSVDNLWKGHHRQRCFFHQCFTTEGLTLY